MKRIIYLILILLLNFHFNIYSQKQTFKFETESCSCIGKYKESKIATNRIENTYKYLYSPFDIKTNATPWRISEISEIPNLNIDTLKKECQEKLSALDTSEFVDSKYWNNIRECKVKEITQTCRLSEFTIVALSNPDTLLHYETTDSISRFYRDALIDGGQKLLDAWFVLNEYKKSRNWAPEKLQKKFEEKMNSELKYEYAKLDIIKFGWWNTSNHLIYHMQVDATFDEEFKNLFYKVKCKCYSP